jgi:hypothetical protein
MAASKNADQPSYDQNHAEYNEDADTNWPSELTMVNPVLHDRMSFDSADFDHFDRSGCVGTVVFLVAFFLVSHCIYYIKTTPA